MEKITTVGIDLAKSAERREGRHRREAGRAGTGPPRGPIPSVRLERLVMRWTSRSRTTGLYRWLQATSSAKPALHHLAHEICQARIVEDLAVAGH